MCKTSDDESGQEDNDDDDEDDFWNTNQKDDEDKSENTEYRMDTPRGLSKWKWDDEVFMANSSKTKFVAENDDDGFENWLMDSGATTHVAKTTKKMFNLKTAIDGEHVRVGSNETLKATAIGDVCLEQKHTNKRMILREVMVIPNFARNLISVGRLNENGNEFVSRKDESELRNLNGETMKFEKESDGMTYLKASRVTPTNEVYNSEDTSKRGEETIEKRRQEAMDINEAHRKFGHATEKVVRSLLKSQGIKPTGDWAVCDGCARAKATQKRTNKITTTEAEERGERLYMDTSGPYNETVAGSRYWFKIVDDKTRKSWDFYGAKKNGIKTHLQDLLDKLKSAGIHREICPMRQCRRTHFGFKEDVRRAVQYQDGVHGTAYTTAQWRRGTDVCTRRKQSTRYDAFRRMDQIPTGKAMGGSDKDSCSTGKYTTEQPQYSTTGRTVLRYPVHNIR